MEHVQLMSECMKIALPVICFLTGAWVYVKRNEIGTD